ncbi:uncharacterized protein EKO05_0010924 [Ascochyta rabiei]|uniref:uncharacterized protein n=1 Tax=Didymella rabiei TaxID=5454 RepID=UPI002209BAC0|nr:uncharacterized protein EKO05_0010924 [Ascochyta rabiei]UPX20699.1 hypothetical protein EKO05_0010924 [Ascochyta rabiei]
MKLITFTLLVGCALSTPAAVNAFTPTRRAASCDAAKVAQLSGGIQANLEVQKNELAGIKDLQSIGEANSTDSANKFAAQKLKVLAIQQQGIDIRAMNQAIADEITSPATAGLKTVQGAQATEMRQVMGLTGNGKTDDATYQMLVQEVQDGTKQNQANYAAAKGQCKA